MTSAVRKSETEDNGVIFSLRRRGAVFFLCMETAALQIIDDRQPDRESIVIVGNGPVGMRTAHELRRLDAHPRITVLGEEPWRPYDRVRLSSFVAGELRHDALYDARAPEIDGIDVITEARIERIDRETRCVYDAHGRGWRYRKLVLATGSSPRVPLIPGRELDGVYVFRSLADAQALIARQLKSRSTVVIGGGLLGLEAARAMRRYNTQVHVVEHEPRLMFHQLDDAAEQRLRRHIEALGIRVHTGQSVRQIVGVYEPESVLLRDGTQLHCDTVVIATGIAPNVTLARDSGLAVGHGIRVDDAMRTTDPEIYAVGECCEHRDTVYGLVGPGIEQAAVAASNIHGSPAAYLGSVVASSLKVVGCPVFSMGDVEDSVRPYSTFTFTDANVYRRVNVYRGRLVGAVGIGEWDVARLRSAGLENQRIRPWQRWLFVRTGRLWFEDAQRQVARWPQAATVCSCRGVTRGELSAALAGGAASLAALSECTGAATVCGSCKPLLHNLLGNAAGMHTPRWLLGGSIVATVLAVLALFVWLPYAQSVAGASWDALWTNTANKRYSGYTLLGLSLLLSLVALRKRIRAFSLFRFSSWQLVHVLAGVAAVAGLAAHTGFRFGANLNAWLMVCFTLLLLVGGLAGLATARVEGGGRQRWTWLRRGALWAHIVLLWPLPVLLGFHIFKGYYF